MKMILNVNNNNNNKKDNRIIIWMQKTANINKQLKLKVCGHLFIVFVLFIIKIMINIHTLKQQHDDNNDVQYQSADVSSWCLCLCLWMDG